MLSEPCQATATSDRVDSCDAGQHNQSLKWLQGKLLHYGELKKDLVELLKVYKEQIDAAQYHLQDCWGDTYVKVLSNIRWFKKELHKHRHRHNRACRAYEHVARRLNALQQGVLERVSKPQRQPVSVAVRQCSVGNTKPVCVYSFHTTMVARQL